MIELFHNTPMFLFSTWIEVAPKNPREVTPKKPLLSWFLFPLCTKNDSAQNPHFDSVSLPLCGKKMTNLSSACNKNDQSLLYMWKK
jgi:hypothetical protein